MNTDIRTLWNEDISEFCAGVVLDDEYTNQMYVNTKYYRSAGIDYRAYFNSGILLINLKNINLNIDFVKESMRLLSEYEKFSDQDVLNTLLKDKVKFIDKKYNFLINLQKSPDEKLAKQIKTKAILHFAGYLKPWNRNNSEVYNIGGYNEKRNIDIVKFICQELHKTESLITHIADRKGHDLRYAIDPTKITNELGWRPKIKFAEGIKKTIRWYLENRSWWEDLSSR